MQVPATPGNNNEAFIEILGDVIKRPVVIMTSEGPRIQWTEDYETLYWKFQDVDSEHFGRLVYELKILEGLIMQAPNFMTRKRAEIFVQQGRMIIDAFRYSIDSLSGQSRRDKHNNRATLTDKITRYHDGQPYIPKEEMKQGLVASFIGKKQDPSQVNAQ